LQSTEFLYKTQLFPESGYTFKHALTREVAYGSLLYEQRRVLHAQIVDAMEMLYAERLGEQSERLAHHALQGEGWAKAPVECRQAGEKAMTRSAHREATEHFEQALGALTHLPERQDTGEQAIDLRLALRTALLPSADQRRILAYLREAESLAAALNDPLRLARVSLFLSHLFWLMGTYDQAIAAAQHTLALVTAGDNSVLHAFAHRYLSLAYSTQGDYRRAIDCLEQAMVFFEGTRRFELFGQVFLPSVQCLTNLAMCHGELGTFVEGRAMEDAGLRIAEAVDHPMSLMIASWGAGLLALRQGDLHRARLLLEPAMALCRDADLLVWLPLTAAALGAVYTLDNRPADAIALLTQVIEQTITTETTSFQTQCRLSLGEAQMLAGQLEEAHVLAEGALALANRHQEQGNRAYALLLLGQISARCAPPGVRARRSPLPASPHPGQGTRHAPAP